MYRDYRVAVVMPIHNEGDHLTRAISRIPGFVDLIFAIDDGSRDDTWQRLCEIKDERLVRLRHSNNLGVGAATRSGYRSALEAGAELIAVMDGDGQMDGRDLPVMLDCAIDGGDYIKGNRFLDKHSISKMPLTRYIGNAVLSWLTRSACSFDESLDAQCGYTVIKAASLSKLDLEGLYSRYGFPNEMFFEAWRAGLKIESVPVRTIYGTELSGINPFTVIPVIIYLIARGYVRGRLSNRRAETSLAVQQVGSESEL